MRNYKGIIIEESLDDNRVLNKLDILNFQITEEDDPLERWHIYNIKVSKDEINELSKLIKDKWYMHFWEGRNVIAVFKDRVFEFNYDKRETWESAVKFGLSIGIPESQLNFPID